MDASLKFVVKQWVGAVATTLVLVICVAFLSIPYSLGGHPGEARVPDANSEWHMS